MKAPFRREPFTQAQMKFPMGVSVVNHRTGVRGSINGYFKDGTLAVCQFPQDVDWHSEKMHAAWLCDETMLADARNHTRPEPTRWQRVKEFFRGRR